MPMFARPHRCGSCWVFSATGAMEGARAIASGKPAISLSEEEYMACYSKNSHGAVRARVHVRVRARARAHPMCVPRATGSAMVATRQRLSFGPRIAAYARNLPTHTSRRPVSRPQRNICLLCMSAHSPCACLHIRLHICPFTCLCTHKPFLASSPACTL